MVEKQARRTDLNNIYMLNTLSLIFIHFVSLDLFSTHSKAHRLVYLLAFRILLPP